jgi:glycosyltransferase involved in cell wall biosynthesis
LDAISGLKVIGPDLSVGLICPESGPLLDSARSLGAETEVIQAPQSFESLGDSNSRGRAWSGKIATVARGLRAVPAIWRYASQLKRAIQFFRPDIVHSNSIKTHLLSRLCVPRHLPVVWHVHDFYGSRPFAGKLLRRASKRVNAAIAISRAVAVDAKAVLGEVPIVTISNSVDVSRFSPGLAEGIELDRRAGLPAAPNGTIRIGLVATYARWKGQLTFLKAAGEVARAYPGLPIRWFVIGGPIYHTAAQFTESELRQAAAGESLANRVGWIPFTSDPVAVYRSLDIVIHASTLPEPFGLTIAEAMACGRAVVVSRAGGAAELFTDGVDALGTTPGHASELAEAVRQLVEDASLRVRLANAARQTALQKFDSRSYAPQLYHLYQQIISSCYDLRAANRCQIA